MPHNIRVDASVRPFTALACATPAPARPALYADEGGVAAKTLAIQAWPTRYLIRDGRILVHRVGGGAGAYPTWRRIINEHMRRETSTQAPVSPPSNRVNAPVRPVTPPATQAQRLSVR